MGAEVLASAKFWVLMFSLTGITRLDSGLDSLKTMVPSDENAALLATTVEVPPQPVVCEAGANPFILQEETLNTSQLINTTAAFCLD